MYNVVHLCCTVFNTLILFLRRRIGTYNDLSDNIENDRKSHTNIDVCAGFDSNQLAIYLVNDVVDSLPIKDVRTAGYV